MADVLINGAGPTGLAHALWLTKQGVKVRIIDKSAGPGETSRAMAVQARTLELYRQMDLAEQVVDAGLPNPAMNIWVGGKKQAQISMTGAGEDVTPYPFMHTYPQDKHERLLISKLAEFGISVERKTELLSFEDKGTHVAAKLHKPDGSEEIFEAKFLSGCDGAKSVVRHGIGAGFVGGTYKQIFYVADVQVSGLDPPGEAHISLDSSDFVAILSYNKTGGARLIGTVQDERAEAPESLKFDDVSHIALNRLGTKIEMVNWFSAYRVHHRVTDKFRQGRVFLCGDAAHVHSPAGGQGMNTGIADAINLAWKLAAVLHEQAPDSLLDSYQIERQAFAHTLVNTTDRIFTFVATEGTFANFARTRIAPLAMGIAYRFDSVKNFMFRMVSQTSFGYRESPVSEGKAGYVIAGDRLPWAAVDGADNFEPLRKIGWQLHVYGTVRDELQAAAKQHDIVLHAFVWNDKYGAAGFARDAQYLVRPDTYVAFADPEQSVAELEAYIKKQGLKLSL